MAEQLAPLEVIERTRRGEPVDGADVEGFVRAWIEGTADDALMASWCMAACLAGLRAEQAGALTRALIASGDRLELGSLGPTGDVQPTDGGGATPAIVAAPLAAALGVRVATVGSRGIGCSGGIIEALESIPGFVADLPLARFVRQVRDSGMAVSAQTARLTPAGLRLDALREATGTTPSAGLVAASLMSRVIAGGAGAIAIEVACGPGADIPDREAARAAAEQMADLARPWGRQVRWFVTDAGRPRGRNVGHALQIGEAGAVLRGEGPDEVRELALWMAAAVAEAAGVVGAGEGAAAAAAALGDGRALASAERWVEAQGGDPAVWTDPRALPGAPERIDVAAPRAGWVVDVAARTIGEAARWLGAGRLHADQSTDPVVGIELRATVGDRVAEGDPLAVVHARDAWAGERGRAMAAAAFTIGDRAGDPRPLILEEVPAHARAS